MREGIIKHSRDYTEAEVPDLAQYELDSRPTLEAQLIDWVDEIAYNTADLDDALEANLLDLDSLCVEDRFFGEFHKKIESQHPEARTKLKFNEALRQVVDFLVSDLISNTQRAVQDSGARTAQEIRHLPKRLAGFSDIGRQQNALLKKFLFTHVYTHPLITEDCGRSVQCLEELFRFYLGQPDSMPDVVVCDYIAGMTDKFLLRQHQEHFGSAATSRASVR